MNKKTDKKMNKIITCISALLLALSATAQTASVKKSAPTVNDIINVMENQGIFINSYDMTEFNDGVYSIVLFVEEYEEGVMNEQNSLRANLGINKTDVRKFGERADIWRETYGMKRRQNIHTLMERISIHTLPSSDTTMKVTFDVKNIGGMGCPLSLKRYGKGPQAENTARYYQRPFKMEPQEHAEIIRLPLLLVGAAWYDEGNNIYRFCGEKEIDPALTSEILKDTPHYFIIGVELHETTL